MSISVIVGLGNPGKKYERTRHNIGFDLLDRLAEREGLPFKSEPRFEAHWCKLPDGSILIKPQTFMNLSGRAVRKFMSFFKVDHSALLVIYDDVALPLGNLRFREKGSAGGHNGIKSLIEHLGTNEFARLKIGIGGAATGEMVGHVLGKFSPDERDELENVLVRAGEAVQLARTHGIADAANQFNSSKAKTPKSQDIEKEDNEP